MHPLGPRLGGGFLRFSAKLGPGLDWAGSRMHPFTMNQPTKPSFLSPWDLLPLLGAIALALVAARFWPALPDPIPTHFGAGGQPNGWTPKAAAPWFMFGLPLGCWVVLALVGRFSQGHDPQARALQAAAMAPLRGLLGLGLFLITSLTVLIPGIGLWVFGPVLGGFFALVALGLVLSYRLAKGLVPPEVRQAYRWGLIYHNPEDARIWVPKLVGIGWTLNFAHRQAWWMLLLLLTLPLGLLVLLR